MPGTDSLSPCPNTLNSNAHHLACSTLEKRHWRPGPPPPSVSLADRRPRSTLMNSESGAQTAQTYRNRSARNPRAPHPSRQFVPALLIPYHPSARTSISVARRRLLQVVRWVSPDSSWFTRLVSSIDRRHQAVRRQAARPGRRLSSGSVTSRREAGPASLAATSGSKR